MDLSIEEFGRAVAYMARASEGNWKDPDAAMLERIRIEEKKTHRGTKGKKIICPDKLLANGMSAAI